jgi:nitrite reductase/ring-hydroxylating ferredoxin subunit
LADASAEKTGCFKPLAYRLLWRSSKGAPLCDGVVFDKSVTCTWHGWRFNLTDGRWVDNPKIRVTTYPVRVVGDEIQVAVG